MIQLHTSRVGHPVRGMMSRWVGLMAVMLGLHSPTAWAAEPVKINSLLTYPEAYKMKVVQVEGTVQNYRMTHFIGERSKLEKCIQMFSVEDETGTVEASYATICNMGTVMLNDGDQVKIEGHFLGALDVRLVTKR
jgi:hypothetical protein